MIPDIGQFTSIIADLEVIENLNRDGVLIYRLKIVFTDSSILFATDINISFENRRKYSFHWQDSEKSLISRWDNAPHYPEIITYPNHQHLGSEENVLPSSEMNLVEILEIIQEKIKK